MKSEIKDKCLFCGLPELAFLAVSLLAAIHVGNDFHGNWLVESVTLIGCNAMLWMLYLLFQSTLWDACNAITILEGKTDKGNDKVEEDEQKTAAVEQPIVSNELPFITQTAEQYQQRNSQFIQEQEARKRELVSAVLEYVNYTMPPFVRNEDMAKLCNEILMWTQNPDYEPCAVTLKSKLSTLDLRHFIWNIGERLGKDNGYDGSRRALFVKRMFPDVFADIEIDSIRNFKIDPNKGHIKIEEPSQGSFAFHYNK